MDDRSFFDNMAATWDDNEVMSTPGKVADILKIIGVGEGEAVMDLGTGTGVLLPEICRLVGPGGRVTAVDYSSGMLARAREKFSTLEPKPEFINADIENDTLPGEYDKILLYCVYPHLHTPIDTLKWLRRVNLKKDGAIYIAFPSDESFINNIHKEKHSESDMLPSAENLASRLRQQGVEAEVVAYSPSMYIVKC